jgi:hypothetical protein
VDAGIGTVTSSIASTTIRENNLRLLSIPLLHSKVTVDVGEWIC